MSTCCILLGCLLYFWENDSIHPSDPRLRSSDTKAIPPWAQWPPLAGLGARDEGNALSHLNCKTITYNSSHERSDKSLPFFFFSQMFISILHIFLTSCPPCTLLAFVPSTFHQFVSFLSDVLKAQQKLIQSNTNFPVCCIIKCSAWCVRSPPVIKCQLQQCLVPPGSSCCHFHFPPKTKHLKTEKS